MDREHDLVGRELAQAVVGRLDRPSSDPAAGLDGELRERAQCPVEVGGRGVVVALVAGSSGRAAEPTAGATTNAPSLPRTLTIRGPERLRCTRIVGDHEDAVH